MHIAEGYLPVAHALGWGVAALPFVAVSVRRTTILMTDRRNRLTLAASGAFLFALTALKLPSVTGSSSHPAGTALGVFLLGPMELPVLSVIVLLFQALLLAHGGLTTLGANVFSLGVAGPLVTALIVTVLRRTRLRWETTAFTAGVAGDLATYLMTSLQLALAFPDSAGGVWSSFLKFAGIFFVTQIPIAIVESLLTVAVLRNVGVYLSRSSLPGWLPIPREGQGGRLK